MKNLKMLALLAAAIAALTAVVGASTASATVLCKNDLNTASCSEKVAKETVLEGFQPPFTNQIFESLGGEQLAKCTQWGFIELRVENAGGAGATVSTPIPSLDWANKGEGCLQVTQTLKPGKLEIHHITNTDDGTVTASSIVEVTFMLEATDCIYGAAAGTHFGTLEGGAPAVLRVNAVMAEQGVKKPACPDSVRFTSSYEFSKPPGEPQPPLYVSAA